MEHILIKKPIINNTSNLTLVKNVGAFKNSVESYTIERGCLFAKHVRETIEFFPSANACDVLRKRDKIFTILNYLSHRKLYIFIIMKAPKIIVM